VRGKVLGIVGYGHIGRQLGVLAESLGIRVIFHDIVSKLPMGNNRAVATLGELLGQSTSSRSRSGDAPNASPDRCGRARPYEEGAHL